MKKTIFQSTVFIFSAAMLVYSIFFNADFSIEKVKAEAISECPKAPRGTKCFYRGNEGVDPWQKLVPEKIFGSYKVIAEGKIEITKTSGSASGSGSSSQLGLIGLGYTCKVKFTTSQCKLVCERDCMFGLTGSK